MNSKNSATSDKKILKRSDNMLLYQTLLSIYYTWKNIKTS